jgi:MFS transporter, SP family, general alpha glucoside:H+ symporter
MATGKDSSISQDGKQHINAETGALEFTAIKAGNAKEAVASEKRLSLLQALHKYPAAAGWSMLVSTTIVLTAYDSILLNSFYAYPSFQQKYGKHIKGSKYQIPASWQSGLSDGSNVGGIIGLVLAGFLVDRFGHKRVTLGALLAIVALVFIQFFAPNLGVLEVGEILCGIPLGIFQGITTAYASELAPVVLRPYLTSYINLCWVFGHFLGAGILRGLLKRKGKWSYKIPFAIQWVWPVPLFLGILFAPDSPWFHIRKGRLDRAEKSLRRLTTRETTEKQLDDALALMVRTNELEHELQSGTTFFDCFKGVDLRRTEIAVMAYLIQYLSGNGLSGYSTYFFEQAGLTSTDSFDLTMAQYAIGFVGTICSWWLMSRLGRRTLYIAGLASSTILLYTIGFVALAPKKDKNADWGTGALLLVYFCVHSTTIGPVLYAIIGEIPSTRLRQKTIVLAASAWSIMGIINSALTPYMLNPTAWNWKGKAGFFWGSFCLLSLVWAIFRLPEGKNRTYAELDALFAKRVSAWKFKNYEIDPLEGEPSKVPLPE